MLCDVWRTTPETLHHQVEGFFHAWLGKFLAMNYDWGMSPKRKTRSKRKSRQEIAVFGESGSGKTVLVSAFYGLAQESQKDKLYWIFADDTGQGNTLYQNYLRMRDDEVTPLPDQFKATSYSFTISMRNEEEKGTRAKRDFDALRLVWHDYPGEWFGFDPTGEEKKRKVDTFRSLLSSDVAVVLVDGQKLLDNRGEEERYLKGLFTTFRNGFLSLRDDILDGGTSLDDFPRIWILALSKSDLWPDMDVIGFRDLVIAKAGQEITELRNVLAGYATAPEAMSFGEDFLLLSAAEFSPDQIDLKKRTGLELLLPFAAVLPFQRHLKWTKAALMPAQVVEKALGSGAVDIALLLADLVPAARPLRRLRAARGIFSFLQNKDALDRAATVTEEKIREIGAKAREKHDFLAATISGFVLDIEAAEDNRVYLRSLRWK